jgi:hypothetical protein
MRKQWFKKAKTLFKKMGRSFKFGIHFCLGILRFLILVKTTAPQCLTISVLTNCF